MNREPYEDYQYNSCVSKGICSISPQVSALQTVLVLYLRLFSKYAIELEKKVEFSKETKEFILNTIATTIYNPEFNEKTFLYVVKIFRIELPKIMKKLSELNLESNLGEEKSRALELFKETNNINSAIKYGEKHLLKVQEILDLEIRNLYSIMLVVIKSLSINLLDLESFGKEQKESFSIILKKLSIINLQEKSVDKLKKEIIDAVNKDSELMKILRKTQEEHYGVQGLTEVSYSTTPAKVALVVGSNIKELEIVLESLKNEEIDVYTHDDMMLAHTFPRFLEYKNLKGQYGQGLENCLLDFATFPGPIILTKHSLHNIENFYRGRLFTTDYAISPQGIIKIKDNDFSEVINSAKNAKGFKTGKQCETIVVGFDLTETKNILKKRLEDDVYKKIFLIGLDDFSLEQKSYFEKLIKLTPKDTLIISFSYNSERENLVHVNACFDSYAIMRVFEIIKDYKKDTKIFFPKCDRNTISQMIYLSTFEQVEVFVSKCTPIILNPTLMKTLQAIFGIKGTTSAKKDLESFMKD